MLEHSLDKTNSILYLRPTSSLQESDFAALAKTVDPHIEQSGDLAGIILEAAAFPGWDSFGAMASHFRFVRDHHKRVRKIAIVTDSAMGTVGEHFASHFVAAELRHFPAGELEAAKQWIAKRG